MRGVVGTKQKSTQTLYEKQNLCYIPITPTLSFVFAGGRAAHGIGRKIDLRGLAHNLECEFRRRLIFFTPNGRNPLKSPDSKK
jgi:hypothetical protein